MRNRILIFGFLLGSLVSFGQSDDPCGAPALTVSTTCTYATYTTTGATASSGVPAPGCASYSGGDVWFTVTVPAGGSLTITTDNIDFSDGGMAVYSGTCTSLSLESCNDDGGPGLMPAISLTGQTAGATLWVRFWEYGNNDHGQFQICATAPPPNSSCDTPEPVCSGAPIVFPTVLTGNTASSINPGNNYSCLSTSPDPTWYYLEISVAGNLVIDMSAASDIDYALWGPFADLSTAQTNCNSYGVPIQCSYSASATEQATVNGVTVGQVYVLVVTNYAGTVQTISINEAAANSAETDCSIVPLGVEYNTFDAYFKEGGNKVVWSTLSETNSDYFILEKSSDAKVWEFVDIQKAAGNSSQEIFYSAIDKKPTRGGIDYYRLKQFDLDGSVEISEIIFVKNGNNIDFTIFPNPAENEVKISSQSEFNKIEMIDLSGKVVHEMEVPKTHNIQIDLSELINGIYFVKVSDLNGNSQMKKLIVQ